MNEIDQADSYMTKEEIAEDVFNSMDDAFINALKDIENSDMIIFHNTTGRAIRNYYRLWEAENPYTDNSDAQGDLFADQVSHTILEIVWEKVNKKSEDENLEEWKF